MADPSRSEPATQRRKQEARRRGQVARSAELTGALVLLAVLLFFRYAGGPLLASLGLEATGWWGHLAPGDLRPEAAAEAGAGLAGRILGALAPLFGVALLVAVAANVAQVGFLFTTEPISPKIDNVNPVQGFQRMFSQRTFVEMAKGLVKIGLVAWVVVASIRGAFQTMMLESVQTVGAAFGAAATVVFRTGLRVALLLLAIAVLDYLYQRYAWERSLRMTRQEVKDEYRQLEGDPLVKARIRQLQREASRRRMIAEIPGADVVITNPIHLAVAVKYEPGEGRAPLVVAKGARLIAQRIKEIARAHGVPLHEDPPLAQALFSVGVGAELPPNLYHAVAQVLAFVYHASRRDKAERVIADVQDRRAREAAMRTLGGTA